MFINENAIKIVLFWKKTGSNSLRILTSLDALKDKEKEGYQKASFSLRPLTWRQHNDIQREATIDKGPGTGSELDWVSYKERKLMKILVGWDAVDAEGKPIPVTEENIFKLHPMVAETILNEFDRVTMLGEDDRKNS